MTNPMTPESFEERNDRIQKAVDHLLAEIETATKDVYPADRDVFALGGLCAVLNGVAGMGVDLSPDIYLQVGEAALGFDLDTLGRRAAAIGSAA